MHLWSYVEQAGLIGYILVVLDVIALALILERFYFWTVYSKSLSSNQQVKTLANLDQGNDYIRTLNPAYQAFKGLQLIIDTPHLKSEVAQEVAISRAVRDTSRFNPVLDTLAAVAPMLGILGTMMGIIQSFSGIAGDSPDMSVMVGGISVAMLTTAMGLIVSIKCTLFYNYFSNKAYQCQLQMDEFLKESVEVLLHNTSQDSEPEK